MDINLKDKIAQQFQMLATLKDAIEFYQRKCTNIDVTDPEAYATALAARDSVIKRLEYCTDSFWKILKLIMEHLGLKPDNITPKIIIRTAAKNHLISELEAEKLIDVITERNKTSHIYLEEIADHIAKHAPRAYSIMHLILERLASNINL